MSKPEEASCGSFLLPVKTSSTALCHSESIYLNVVTGWNSHISNNETRRTIPPSFDSHGGAQVRSGSQLSWPVLFVSVVFYVTVCWVLPNNIHIQPPELIRLALPGKHSNLYVCCTMTIKLQSITKYVSDLNVSDLQLYGSRLLLCNEIWRNVNVRLPTVYDNMHTIQRE